MANHSTPMPRAGWSVESLIRTSKVARDSSFTEDEPGILVSPAFWLGGLFSVGLWTALAWALTS